MDSLPNSRMSLLLMMMALMSLVAQAEVRASSTSTPESQRYSFTTAKADDATAIWLDHQRDIRQNNTNGSSHIHKYRQSDI